MEVKSYTFRKNSRIVLLTRECFFLNFLSFKSLYKPADQEEAVWTQALLPQAHVHTCTPTHTLAQIQVLKLVCILSLKITELKHHLECLQKHSCFYGFCEKLFESLARPFRQKGVLQVFYGAFWKLRMLVEQHSSFLWGPSTGTAQQ